MQALKEWSALKEWAVVVRALEEGKQCVLFRKGGILDPGFSVESPEFLLFPTFEHQGGDYLKDDYKTRYDELLAGKPQENVTITSAAKVVAARETGEKQTLYKLSKYHIYDNSFIDYRMEWNKDQPMNVLLVRTYELAAPLTIKMLPEYSGCRSWIRIRSTDANLGKPVIEDKEFNGLKSEIEVLLA
ncbi:MAG: DUF1802 family protein [Nitrososphaerales archaeon]